MLSSAWLPAAKIALREHTPVATDYDDIYFSKEDGIAETTHVFLQGNGLPERWQGAQHFHIAELGFGTGLNFLVTWQRFRETAPADAVLHYEAVEHRPLTREQLAPLLAMHPTLATEAAHLLAAYPLRLPGPHRITLPQCALTLWWGEAADWLACPRAHVDAWYLDGFAPAKNPDMWHEAQFAAMARQSHPATTLATFTAASAVRRGLEAAGFRIEKCRGYGKKRDMLRGTGLQQIRPHHSPAARECIVIGGGIAGTHVAHALAEAGCDVTLLTQAAIADGASGNPAGVCFPRLSKRWQAGDAFYFTAYSYALQQLPRWHAQGLDFTYAQPGMLRLAREPGREEELRASLQQLQLDASVVRWCEREEASAIAGMALAGAAAYFPHGTWLTPARLCTALATHPRIALHTGCAAQHLARVGDAWQVTTADGRLFSAPQLVIATAAQSPHLLAPFPLPLQAVGGQVSVIDAAQVTAPLRSILCRKGYVIPLPGQYLIGATYHRERLLEVNDDRHRENLAELASMLPGWAIGAPIAGRSSIRATTPDRLPYIGEVAPGLYVSLGHGSRGLLSAPLSAAILVGQMTGEPFPLAPEIAAVIAPNRRKLL
jgi:tRNA 5-methylaminomethyl-2-thiouridine biosynthesis bifunctional protein